MRRLLAVLVLACAGPAPLVAQTVRPDSAFLAAFRWRSIGPANMTGRVTDIEGNPLNPKEVYVAFATGGVWKTVNAGLTWTPIFDRTGVHAASEIAIAPSDTNTIYVGTGEVNSRNSISPGAGVFRSTDGGRTWTPVGLRETEFIGRILVHPTDPKTVWVAALGHAWGPNRERGIYKTTDGGQTWKLVKFVSDRAGFVDLAMDPSDPNVLFATSWERVRGPYYLQSGGPGSGLWKSTDGGENWTRITGNGLPTTTWGRASVAVAPSRASTMYVLAEADSQPNPESVRQARQKGFAPDTTKRAKLQSGLFRSTDGGQTWTKMNSDDSRPFYYSQVRVDPKDADRVYFMWESIRFSNDGGKTSRTVGQGLHTDNHAMWIDPTDPDHYLVGEDGGIAQTYDRGRTYDALLQMAVGQFYAIGLDMQRPFWVCGGLQDNGSWCGPSVSPRGRISNEDWTNVNGGDGFYAAIDPTNPNIIYSESQGGSIARLDLRTWERRGIRPGTIQTAGGGGGGFFGGGTTIGRMLEDSVVLARGDTTQPATPAQQHVIDSLRVRIAADTAVLLRNRFNWSSPFFISSHNPQTLYMGGHRVWKTVDRGDHWYPISEDLSTRDSAKIRMSMARTGGVTLDATGAETHGTVTTLAESPARPGIIWAGTDDGSVWLTRNDGANWEDLTGHIAGVPRNTWVSRVEASNFDSATVYVTFDGHRGDDFHPYLYVSKDFGKTFRSIKGNLPDTEYVHVIREDPRRRNLLFLGTELTAYVSTDSGETWTHLNNGLPPAPVHDLKIHPRDRQLVAATHGRSIYVMDIGPLEQATDSLLSVPVAVFAPEPALEYNMRGAGGGVGAIGSRPFGVPTPRPTAEIPIRIRGEQPQIAQGPGGRPGADTAQFNPMAAMFGEQAAQYMQEAGLGGGGGRGGGLMALLMGGGGRPSADTVPVVITDMKGDTVRVLYTNARPAALRYITWDLRREREPLGPAAVRDSARAATRIAAVRDSLRKAAGDTTAGARPTNLMALLRDPERGEPGSYNNPIQQALGGGFGFRGAGGLLGGTGPMVEPGTYLVTIRLDGKEYKRAIQVVRPSESSELSGGWR